MNRPRKHNKDKGLPPCVYIKANAYYYVKGGKWTHLGREWKAAMARYATLYEGGKGSMQELIARSLPIICEGKKANTVAQYTIAARRLAKLFAEFQVEDVQPKNVAKMKRELSATPNMANRCLSVLRLILEVAVEDQIIARNPASDVKMLEEKERKRLLTMPELTAIYRAAGPRLRVIIDLALRTGQRIGDVLKIKRADLLKEGIRFEQQKTDARLIIPWTTELREVVDRANALHQNIRAFTLLHNRRGKAPDYRTVRDQWERACAAAKVADAHLHDLRAMSATYAKRQGIDAQALLGHTSAAQTSRYLRDRDATIADGPSFGSSKNLLEEG